MACESIQRILFDVDGATFGLDLWAWVYHQILFELEPVVAVSSGHGMSYMARDRRSNDMAEARSLCCIVLLSQVQRVCFQAQENWNFERAWSFLRNTI